MSMRAGVSSESVSPLKWKPILLKYCPAPFCSAAMILSFSNFSDCFNYTLLSVSFFLAKNIKIIIYNAFLYYLMSLIHNIMKQPHYNQSSSFNKLVLEDLIIFLNSVHAKGRGFVYLPTFSGFSDFRQELTTTRTATIIDHIIIITISIG